MTGSEAAVPPQPHSRSHTVPGDRTVPRQGTGCGRCSRALLLVIGGFSLALLLLTAG